MKNVINPNFDEKTSYTELIRKLHDAEKRAETAEKENTKIIEQNKDFQRTLKVFEIPEFDNLAPEDIAALAKCSQTAKNESMKMINSIIDITQYFERAKESGTFDDYKKAIEEGLKVCEKYNPFMNAIKEG